MRNYSIKKLVLPLLLLLAVAQGRAQVGDAGDFHFMPKVGFSLSTLMNLSSTMRSGVNAGVGGEYQITDRFSVEGGVYYSMQGASNKMKLGGEYFEINLNNDYINIPVYAKFYVYEGLNIFAGPQLGIGVNNSFSLEGPHAKVYETVDTHGLFRPLDFALCVGGGYQLENGLFLSVNYNFGLLDVLKPGKVHIKGEKTEWEITQEGVAEYNGVLQANIGWRF